MKLHVILAVGLAALSIPLAAPAAASPICTEGQSGCPAGDLACVEGKVCVIDPCYTTRCLTPTDVSCAGLPSIQTEFVGVSSYDCIHVDGYVCVPTWYGGNGLLGGFACGQKLGFALL